jgi:hypothetical protein
MALHLVFSLQNIYQNLDLLCVLTSKHLPEPWFIMCSHFKTFSKTLIYYVFSIQNIYQKVVFFCVIISKHLP